MTVVSDYRVPLDVTLVIPALLKASAIASLVFALAWFRWPLSPQLLMSMGFIFVKYGILISLFSMCIGVPIIHTLARFRAGQWWVYLLAAAVAGSLLAGVLSPRPGGRLESQFARSFSLWTRYGPDFAGPPVAFDDYVGWVVLGAVVGGILGIAFWYFYSRGLKIQARGAESAE